MSAFEDLMKQQAKLNQSVWADQQWMTGTPAPGTYFPNQVATSGTDLAAYQKHLAGLGIKPNPLDVERAHQLLDQLQGKPNKPKKNDMPSLLKRLLQPDLSLIEDYALDSEGNLDLHKPLVQQAILEVIQDKLIVLAKAEEAKKEASKKTK